MTPKRRIDGDLRESVRMFASRGWTPSQIDRKLHTIDSFEESDLPSLRTIQRIVAEMAETAPAPRPWTLWTSALSDESNRIVMDTLLTIGHDLITEDEARALARARQARPDMPAEIALAVAIFHCGTASLPPDRGERRARGLHYFVTFAPWRDAAHRAQYEGLATHGFFQDGDDPTETIESVETLIDVIRPGSPGIDAGGRDEAQ